MGAEGESQDTKRGICSGTYLHDQGWGGRAVHSGRHQQKPDAGLSYFRCWRVKSSTVVLKTLHSEETEWVSSFGTCYKILLYVKGQGWGGTARGTPSFQPQPLPFSSTLARAHVTHTQIFKEWKIITRLSLLTRHLHIFTSTIPVYTYLSLIRTHTTNLHASIYMAFVTPHKSKLWHDKLTTPVDFFPFVSVCNWSAL